ncbi:MAG TPA: hypothetical protein VK689_03365 [Armatimonadota bacterium]|nr:hypothetical protein [Armatimonadota bacterium]
MPMLPEEQEQEQEQEQRTGRRGQRWLGLWISMVVWAGAVTYASIGMCLVRPPDGDPAYPLYSSPFLSREVLTLVGVAAVVVGLVGFVGILGIDEIRRAFRK